MKRFKRQIHWLAVLSLPLFITGCQDQPVETSSLSEAQIRPVKVYQLGTPQNTPTRTLAGTIEAVDRADLSFRVSGTIARINVESGAQVSKGDALAILDKTQLQLALDSARAQRLRAQAIATEAQ